MRILKYHESMSNGILCLALSIFMTASSHFWKDNLNSLMLELRVLCGMQSLNMNSHHGTSDRSGF